MITQNKIKKIISEAAGVPDDIDMMTNIFTNMVKDYMGKFKKSGKDLDVGEADIKNYGETEFDYGNIEITENSLGITLRTHLCLMKRSGRSFQCIKTVWRFILVSILTRLWI